MDPKDRVAVLDFAQAYAEQAGSYLTEGLQRKPTTEEIQQFCSMACSILLGSVYASVRKHESPDAAKAMIEKTLAFSGNIVRMMGLPVAMGFKLDVHETPQLADNDTQEAVEGTAAEPARATCECQLDTDGCCEECVEKIRSFYLKVSGFWEGMGKAMRSKKGTCAVCDNTQFDRAISSIVPEILQMGQNILDAAGDSVRQNRKQAILHIGQELLAMLVASGRGVPMPLTQTAWEAEVRKRVEKDAQEG